MTHLECRVVSNAGLIPPELKDGLKAHPAAAAVFDAMPPSHRAEYANWVGEAKRAETRARRAAEAVKKIAAWGKEWRGKK
jgi:uncharacterized protein YdeI (YjbR/CyaY-like superfamily)